MVSDQKSSLYFTASVAHWGAKMLTEDFNAKISNNGKLQNQWTTEYL